MITTIINWFKNIRKKDVKSLSIDNLQLNNNFTHQAKNTNSVYLNDPTTPKLMIEEDNRSCLLPVRSVGESGCGYSLGSIQQQALASKQIVSNALNYMCSKTEGTIKNWAATNSLTIMSRAGQDINAYYDRSTLRFFYFSDPKKNKIVFFICMGF